MLIEDADFAVRYFVHLTNNSGETEGKVKGKLKESGTFEGDGGFEEGKAKKLLWPNVWI